MFGIIQQRQFLYAAYLYVFFQLVSLPTVFYRHDKLSLVICRSVNYKLRDADCQSYIARYDAREFVRTEFWQHTAAIAVYFA